MTASRTARERARAELTGEIKREARRQLAEHGADGLSLRAVARELGMVSSALYRYFPSRDDLLTALIVDAYNALGAAVERAVAGRRKPRPRWRAGCQAAREWAVANPHEYALIYGSPIPGYAAPVDTVTPAARVPAALLGIVGGCHVDGTLRVADTRLSATLREQVEAVARTVAPDVPAVAVARTLIAWTQLFGMLSFELFGQFAGAFDPAAPAFDYAVDEMAEYVGLPA